MKIEEGVSLSRLTTLGTGGPATAFARPESLERARGGARLGRASAACRSRRSGSARTCSSPTRASTRSCSSSAGSSRRSSVDGERARRRRRRAERRLPPPRARGRARRLRVRLRDPGHDRRRRLDERRRVRQRLGGDPRPRARRRRAAAPRWLTPAELGLSLPALRAPARPGRRARPSSGSRRGRSDEIKATVAETAGAAQGDAADEQAHVRQRLQEPRPRAERGADARGVRPARATGSAARRSRRGTRTSSRTPAARRAADAIALMAEARRRALEQFGVELEHEVELLGALELPAARAVGAAAVGGELRPSWPGRAAARACAVRPSTRLPTLERTPLTRLLPSGRSLLVGFAIVLGAVGALPASRARRRCSRSSRSRSRARHPRSPRSVRTALAPLEGQSLLALDSAEIARRLATLPDVAAA